MGIEHIKLGKGSSDPIPEETKKKICQLIKGGYYAANIRERFGVSQTAIREAWDKYGKSTS